ncbi:MAG: error-prone DNA polymerase [Rhodospirillaceae bacterium]|nr:error-prone DNA polymerase [Rhodospirillaceae bacterium]
MRYAELQITTNYSFLRGGSHPCELAEQAAILGLNTIAITDRNSLAGIPKALDAVEQVQKQGGDIRLIIGCRLDLAGGNSLLCYPQDRFAYSRLTRMLTRGKRHTDIKKGQCLLTYEDIAEFGEGQVFITLGDDVTPAYRGFIEKLQADFRKQTYLALTRRFRPNENARLRFLADMARDLRMPTVATNDVLYHLPERRILHDVMTCIRLGKTIDGLGYERELSADRFLKPADEMARLFPHHREAVERTMEIAERSTFCFRDLQYQYPDEKLIPGLTAQQALEQKTWEGAAKRYPQGVPDKVRTQVLDELKLIGELKYAPYFLTVWRIVDFARSRDILCQGRGSAANSSVCYCLWITELDPVHSEGLFARFISAERNEPPDIDVDFEHERREEVIQWIYNTYGRDNAALTATVIHYRTRRAVREVGKALGLSEDVTATLAGSVWGWSNDGVRGERARSLGLDPADWRLRLTLALSKKIMGFPRHLSQHPGGFIISHERLDNLVPIEKAAMEDRTVVSWDKDDIEILKMMKVDVLGLGMLGCLRRAFDLFKEHKKDLPTSVAAIPPDDARVYDMLCKADSVGVFQVESRAQMSMLPRLKPREYYDLVIQVAIVRPGPIQGNMVHPYLKRRAGIEKVSFPKPELEEALKKTLGIPIFQEHAMKIAIIGAGFTPSEADQLRRAMATFRNDGKVSEFRERFITGMVKNDYPLDFAERCFSQIEGFGTYGFPESHAASFAILVYASSWVKCLHPDVFLCAILNAQPLGFYAPAQLVRDAREHGVEVLPVDINHSRWDCTMEGEAKARGLFAVRLGFKQVKGMSEEAAAKLVIARHAPYSGLEEVWRRTGLDVSYLEVLAEADTCGSAGLDRRQALWSVKSLRKPLPLFAAADQRIAAWTPDVAEPAVTLAPLNAGENVLQDYAAISLSLRDHPLKFLRPDLAAKGWQPLSILKDKSLRDGTVVRVAGLVLVRQRPGSSKGVVFVTLEDETSQGNLVVWPRFFEEHRAIVMTSRFMGCVGKLQREGDVIHVVVRELYDLTPWLRRIGDEDLENATPRMLSGTGHMRPPDDAAPLRVKSRDFH